MTKATFVKSARKDYPDKGIAKGESYYWWKFRFGGKNFSKTKPSRAQLTQSNYFRTLYDLEDGFSIAYDESAEDVENRVSDAVSELENLRDETQGSLDNMPEQLQQGDTGQLLQERIDALEEAISQLENISYSDAPEQEEDETKEDYASNYEAWIDDVVNQVQSEIGDCQI